jgi:hypothetical protein
MAVLAGLHFDQQQLSRAQIGGACKTAIAAQGYYPFLDNTSVAASNTNLALRTAVTTAANLLHADNRFAAPRVNLGILLGLYSTELSDARLAGLTTTAGLCDLTYAYSTLPAGGSQPPE